MSFKISQAATALVTKSTGSGIANTDDGSDGSERPGKLPSLALTLTTWKGEADFSLWNVSTGEENTDSYRHC